MLWIGTILFGLSQASIFPTYLTLAEERIHVTGAIAGWFLVGAGLGGMTLPWLIGQAFVQIGAGAMMANDLCLYHCQYADVIRFHAGIGKTTCSGRVCSSDRLNAANNKVITHFLFIKMLW